MKIFNDEIDGEEFVKNVTVIAMLDKIRSELIRKANTSINGEGEHSQDDEHGHQIGDGMGREGRER